MPVDPLTFAMSACQYPAGILDATPAFVGPRTSDHVRALGPAERSLGAFMAWAGGRKPRPAFWLATGDSVYVDATAGLFDPSMVGEAAWTAYAKLLSSKRQAAARNMVGLHFTLLDDHEIGDNWEPSNHGGRHATLDKLLKVGVAAYRETRGLHAPPAAGALWFSQTFGNHGVFFGDTRTEREARSVQSLGVAKIMSDQQSSALTSALDSWQRAWPDSYRFIATPSIFLPRRLTTVEHKHLASALRSDAWDGYPASQHALLAHIADAQISRCVFLSGDEHLGCIAGATVQRIDEGHVGSEVRLWSIHVGAMYAPYPFANSTPFDMADAVDEWEFKHGDGKYRCRVDDVWFPERPRLPNGSRPSGTSDGFVTVEVVPKPIGEAELAVTFRYANPSTGPVQPVVQAVPPALIDQVWQWHRP